jgi:hypothetical protein
MKTIALGAMRCLHQCNIVENPLKLLTAFSYMYNHRMFLMKASNRFKYDIEHTTAFHYTKYPQNEANHRMVPTDGRRYSGSAVVIKTHFDNIYIYAQNVV